MHQKIATVTLNSPPCSCINCNATLAQEKTHTVTFLGVKDVTSSTKFYLRRGASPTHNDSIWMKESTLECSPLNRSPHTWCKVIVVSGFGQHCTFSRNKMGSSGHLSTLCKHWRSSICPSLHIGSSLHCHLRTDSSSCLITSPPSATSSHWSPPRSAERRHLIRRVRIYTSLARNWFERKWERADIYKFWEKADIYKFWVRADIYKFWERAVLW